MAVGREGPWLFLADAEWDPPLGWVPWVGLVLLATLVLAVVATGALSRRRTPDAVLEQVRR